MGFEYRPNTKALVEVIVERSVRRVLIVGTQEYLDLPVDETRITSTPGPIAASGFYVLPRRDGIDLLICDPGSKPTDAMVAAPTDLFDGHPLKAALGWFEHLWPQARTLGNGPLFRVGDHVRIAGADDRLARVEEVRRHDGDNVYVVSTSGHLRTVTEAGLIPIRVDAEDPLTWAADRVVGGEELSVALTVTKLTNPLTDTIYSYLASKTVFRAYQFKPVLKLLASPHRRLLVADEVGLGKTIEAGLVWTELDARSAGLRRVLVVCPAMLVPKWRAEMRRRFDRRLDELDASGLRDLLELLRSGDEDRPFAGVVSLERLRSSSLLADLAELSPSFDLVIVDEAHYLRNRETLSFELGQLLSEWAETLLFLSATPLNLGSDDLFNLLHLLAGDEFADKAIFGLQLEPNRHLNSVAGLLLDNRDRPAELVPRLDRIEECALGSTVVRRPEYRRLRSMLDRPTPLSWNEIAEAKLLLTELNTLSSVLTRTRKVDVADQKAVREAVQIDVDWTPKERAFYGGVLAWARQRAKATGRPLGFLTQMPLRQAASCLPAMRSLIREGNPSLLLGDAADEDFDEYDGDAAAGQIELEPEDWADMLSALRGLGDVDTKFDRFVETLREVSGRGSGRILVFSFFRRTLAYLERRLRAEGFAVRSMHGGVPSKERQGIMRDFRKGDFQILLASEVASEGLDFEFCSAVVNYDLPWNPMRIEQRIGRLDRFGQQHEKIFILNFHVPGTIETDIFSRLYARIAVFERSIGELEPILRDEIDDLQRIALDPDLSPAQRQQRLDQLEVALEQRRKDVDDLAAASDYLMGLDQLMVEGLERDTTGRGRFVGAAELRVLLDHYLADRGAARLLRDPEHDADFALIGSRELAEDVARWGGRTSASTYELGELVPILADEEPIPVTFDAERASRSGTELITLRHPVVRAAVRHLAERPHGLGRFGRVRITGHHGPDFLVLVYLVETTGIRPTLELWPVAVDLTTRKVDEELGHVLLAAVTTGRVLDAPGEVPGDLPALVRAARDAVTSMQLRIEAERRDENELLVDTRLAALRASSEHKIRAVEETLEKVRREGRAKSVIRLHEGRIVNLRRRLHEAEAELQSGRELAVSVHPVLAAIVEGDDR